MSAIIDGTYNSRDTGGMPLRDGGTTRSGVFYRTDALAGVTAAGLETLENSPIGAVVDFRTDVERAQAPDRLPAGRDIRVVQLSILEAALAMPADLTLDDAATKALLSRIPSLADLYRGMLQHSPSAFAEVARLIVNPPDAAHPAVLVHCTAGKDRTGVAVALLLDAIGVERAAIVADYVSSQANLAGEWADGMLARMTAMGVPALPAIVEVVTGTPPSAIEAAFTWLDERGGSAEYLLSGGLTPGELDGLRERLAG
ncbi:MULTISPECIES: tyrosine-protein phosphatase [unclassified Microbacterium]|uniref:tyrosine-protein phosphatase n=1 Tax=unclassified Microbacterium TaxID=2609290 RepID=UPI0012F70C52|nr:protein-tyrosine-phosphatase [Microbacterium sp. MAH-37]